MRQNPLRAFPIVRGLPEVSTDQMIEVDRLMIKVYGIGLLQMMENAGRALAMLARQHCCEGSVRGKKIAVLAGPGGNGGGAITAARRLASWGASISVGLLRPQSDMTEVPRGQLDILSRVTDFDTLEPDQLSDGFDLIIDGLIGYSLRGVPSGRARQFIEAANSATCPRLSLDLPSGFDAANGHASEVVFKADATLTLALPKLGLTRPENQPYVGRLFCADISVPPRLYDQMGLPTDAGRIFEAADIVEIERFGAV